jgi:hypothetical protein
MVLRASIVRLMVLGGSRLESFWPLIVRSCLRSVLEANT